MFEVIPKPVKANFVKNTEFTFATVNYYKYEGNVDKKIRTSIQRILLELGHIWGAKWLREDLLDEHNDPKSFGLIFKQSKSLSEENYMIKFSKQNRTVTIEFSNFKSVSLALATLYQIQIQDEMFLEGEINDRTDYHWRGTLIDISRHFFDQNEIKKLIFIQWLYKQNVLHLHLTDDQGWRIELETLPEILERGSWRYKKSIHRGTYGGYLRKTQIKDLIDFASIFNLDIVPEIDLPGHIQAVVLTYPELLCKDIKPGIMQQINGVSDKVICMSNPKSFEILAKILDEVSELFPSKYFHIGGDEAPLLNSRKCERCQKFIRDNKLDNEHIMQKEFIKKLIKILKSKEKIVIAWDDLVEKEFLDDIIVAHWRSWMISKNPQGYNKLIENGNKILINNSSSLYFDFAQGAQDWKKGIDSLWYTNLQKVYNFNPFANVKENNKKMVLGSEVSIWTEEIRDFDSLTEKYLPRMIAAQEIFWGTKTKYEDFILRLKKNIKLLENLNIKFDKSWI